MFPPASPYSSNGGGLARIRLFEIKQWLPAAILLALMVGGLGLQPSNADVIDPSDPIAGLSQLDHSHLWWQTMFNIPLAMNPVADATGADAFRGQIGSVLYVAGSFGGPTNRTIEVDPGTSFVVPIVTSYFDNTALIGDPPTTLTAAEMLALGEIPPTAVVDMFFEIDGQSVGTTADLLGHRQTTDPNNPFTNVIQSSQNLFVDFGVDPTLGNGDPFDPASYPTSITPVVVDNYLVGLEPFEPGSTHTIRFGGTFDFGGGDVFSQDNFLTVTTTPEPASLALVCGLLLTGVAASRRCRRRKKQVDSPSQIA